MTEIKVLRRSSDGRGTTYCAAVLEETDRTLHNITVGHNELYDFADQPELVRFVVELLLERDPKEEIPSAFRLKDLLENDAAVRSEVEAYRFVRRPRLVDGVEWLTA